jgi:hypothetical protein
MMHVRFVVAVATVAAVMSSNASIAQAQDPFSSFFNTLIGRPESPSQPPGHDAATKISRPLSSHVRFSRRVKSSRRVSLRAATYDRPGAVYCVRTCDGRYFPISADSKQSRAMTCNSFCPASETKAFSGSSIETAIDESGKPYSSLANAFKYREQLVEGCTCNGKDSGGLASISIDDDKTIRKGDIVAGANGLVIAHRTADRKRGGVATYTPAPRSIREKFERSHAMMRNQTKIEITPLGSDIGTHEAPGR